MISGILEQRAPGPSAASALAPPEREALAALMGWLDSSGSRARLRVGRDATGERGAFAAAPIAEGDVVVEVPLPYIITRDLAVASDAGRAIDAAGVKLGCDHAYLAAFLLQERRDEGSFFRPYLDALPTSYPGLPVLFGDDDLALLRGSSALPWIRRMQAAIAAEHGALRRVRAFERLTLSDFLWARLAVSTRVFSLDIGGRKTEGLVPLADMLNHRRERETRWAYDDRAGAFVVTALRAFRPGDPVRQSYGRKGNARLFASYGVAPDDDGGDEAEITLSIPAGDPLLREKLAVLGWRDARVAFPLPAAAEQDGFAAALAALRVACASGEELARIAGRGGTAEAPVSARNEDAALAALAAACEAALAGFETTIEEDDALLCAPGLSENQRRCVRVRRGEKRVLRRALERARRPR